MTVTPTPVGTRAAEGAAWNLAVGIAVRAIGLLGTLALVRHVGPLDYGKVIAAAVCVGTAVRLFSFGTGAWVVARQSSPRETFEATLVHLATLVVAGTAVVALARPLAVLVGAPGMQDFIPGLALAAMIGQSSHIAGATLVRDLRFRAVAMSRGASEIAFSAVSVALAARLGPEAIVAGSLARGVVLAALFFALAKRSSWWAPAPPRLATLRSILAFGIPVAGTQLTNSLATQWDNLMMSSFFGPTVLGQYSLAYSLSATPSSHVAESIGDVLEPSFALVSGARRRSEAARATALMALVVSPLAVGLAAVAPTIVPLLFDPRWHSMAALVMVLSGLSLARPVNWIIEAILRLQLRSGAVLFLELCRAAAVLGGIYALARFGPVWAAAAVPLGFTVHALAALLVGWRIAEIPPRGVLEAVLRPVLAAGLMGVVVVGLRLGGERTLGGGGFPLLILELVAGALSYGAFAWLLARPTVRDLIDLGQKVARSRA